MLSEAQLLFALDKRRICKRDIVRRLKELSNTAMDGPNRFEYFSWQFREVLGERTISFLITSLQ